MVDAREFGEPAVGDELAQVQATSAGTSCPMAPAMTIDSAWIRSEQFAVVVPRDVVGQSP
jgi:hypothetical protein